MTKAQLQQFINDCESAGIKRWALRFEGGNRTAVHGNEGTKIILRDNDVIIIEATRNYATPNGQYNITSCTYEMIDNVRVLDATIKESIDLLTAFGIYDEDMEKFMKSTSKRQDIIPGTAGLAPIKNSDGKDVIPSGSVGYVTV